MGVPGDTKKLIEIGLQRPNLRAFIDVGVQFRGIPNNQGAYAICKSLSKVKSDVQGVLFFEPGSGKLSFIHRDNPRHKA